MPDGDDTSRTPAADEVAALVAAGDHLAAARLAAANGDLPRAIAIYERAWRFADALPLALALGDRARAIRLALDAGDPARANEIADSIPRDAAGEQRAAAAAFASHGRPWEAARAAERAGNPAAAALHYRRAGSLLDAGRMEEATGRFHEAGVAYEQARAAAAGADAAAAELALGRLLGRLGRHHDAARSLQRAGRAPELALAAGRALIAELHALGFPLAAAEIVARLRRLDPALPDTVEEMVALDAAERAAGTSLLGHIAGEPGLLRQRFKIVRSLGAGATSTVYLAEDTLLGSPVALKLLSVGAHGHGAERQAYARFAREADAVGRLRHPNIVALHDADPAMGLFVLELMPGGTLADRLATGGALSPAVVRRLALELLSALGTAHDRGIVHRDVKPANVLFDAIGSAKLGDFGAAHLVDFGQTQTGGLLGTVAYMSPEQISGGAIGPAADLYGLAVTLFQAVTGELPFPGPDIVAQHLGEPPPRPSARRPGLSAAHDAVLLRALAKAPGDRWGSAAEMADAIRAWPMQVAEGSDGDGDGGGGDGDRDGRTGAEARAAGNDPPRAASEAAAVAPELLPLGRSAAGALFRREDPRLGRPVLVEVRDAAVEGAALATLQALAAAGGPYVQRVLALDEDRRTVTYELVDGPVILRAEIGAGSDEEARIADADAVLARAGVGRDQAARIARTPGGPVVLLASPVSSTT